MRQWQPSLNALRAFEVVSRTLNYRLAAEELGVTPAAVKQLVSKLEADAGVPLVERAGRGLCLTERGRLGIEDLAPAMALIQASVEKLRGRHAEKRLFISVESSFSTAWLVPRLDGFRARYPDITVLIDSNQSIVDLHQGHIDVAIRYGVNSASDLVRYRLFDDEVFPACSPTMAEGPPKLNDLKDLDKVPLIHWDISHIPWAKETKRWFTWDGWLAAVGMTESTSNKGLHFSEYGQAIQAAIAGQGVVLASWPILRDSFNSGLLIAPFDERAATDIGYEMVTTAAAAERPEVSAFVDWLVETAIGN